MNIDSQVTVRKSIDDLGPLAAFRKLIADNDALIRSDSLDIGRNIVSERTAIYTELVRHWALKQYSLHGYDKPFAVVALGGTGRGEMTPYSDTDFAFLFEGALEGNSFLLELQDQVVQSDWFEKQYGFYCEALPFSLDDVPDLEGKQLNSFLDMKAVFDPDGLTETFRERIRATYDPFEHFLHVREFWIEEWEKASRRSEDLDRFDIKNDGLRIFLAGIWTLSGKSFCHSQEIYELIEDPRDLEAYNFLLRIRAFVHSRRQGEPKHSATGNHPEDILDFDDFMSFGELAGGDAEQATRFEMGNEVRSRLLSARRRIAVFAKSVIRQELRQGRVASKNNSIVYGLGGLRTASANMPTTDGEKSRSALSLLLASLHYEVPVDLMSFQGTFQNAGDWLVRVPELSSLFYESNGSLADTFEFLSQIDGTLDRLFPGYARFETSLDRRVMTEQKSLRGKLQREKLLALDRFLKEGREILKGALSRNTHSPFYEELSIGVEAALLDADHIAAIKLALTTKRLPITDYERSLRDDESVNIYQRFASGLSEISLEDYFKPFVSEARFSESCIEIGTFLIANRRAFKEYALSGLNDAQQAKNFVELCGDENRLRALFIFTCADRTEWGSEITHPDRWFNIKELYGKAMEIFQPFVDPTGALIASGYSPEELKILKDFGKDFFEGRYRGYANKFGSHLLRLAEEPDFNASKVALLRDGASFILGLAARDFRGLAATISGELWQQGVGLRQAHFFSSSHHGLALDFFHLEAKGKPFPENLTELIQEAIINRLHIKESDGKELPPLSGTITFNEWRPHQYCLRFEGIQENDAIIYTLTYKMYRHLKANIFGLTAHSARSKAFVSIYHNLPENLTPEEAKRLVETQF
ncbi:MAG: DUF294 nucleotidyltransferase-like domain-containing protein [Verrucomicrobia bacterium]|nr:DUF294 nucleotidyltransferase-like domain-containing protein [Verrucomicrobiota bacterium]